MMAYPKCRVCDRPAFWTVKARVPSRYTSGRGAKSFLGHCCPRCLENTLLAAISKIEHTAPARVSLVQAVSDGQ